MKKIIIAVAVLSIIVNVGLVYLFVVKGETAKASDGRTAIMMTEGNRDFVLDEMRGFLESVQQINEGLLEGDATKIINAGKKSGGSVIEHAPNGLMKSLPSGFKSLGFATHDMFDKITESAELSYNEKQIQGQLSTMLNTCVACHKSYKISLKIEN